MNAAASQQQHGSLRRLPVELGGPEPTHENIDVEEGGPNRSLDALLRKQAARLIDWTLHAELELLLARHASITDARGRPAYVRNGYQPPRALLTNLGPVTIRIPKVRSRIDRAMVFRSAVARPYLRRARSTLKGAPAHFLHGLSIGNMHAAIGALMGPEAAALPLPVLRKLWQRWNEEHKRWLTGSLAHYQRVSLWLESIEGADAPPFRAGSVMLAVAIDESASEQILAIVHASGETEHSWAQLLRGLRVRGMPAPQSMHAKGKASRTIVAAAAVVHPGTRVVR